MQGYMGSMELVVFDGLCRALRGVLHFSKINSVLVYISGIIHIGTVPFSSHFSDIDFR